MRTLIVPCAGRKLINGAPRWQAILPSGKIVLWECIKNLNYRSFSRIIVTVLAEDEEKYHASEAIQRETSALGKVETLILNKKTEGPAETVFETIAQKKIKGPVAIKDIGTIINEGENPNSNFIFGIDLLKYESDLQNVRNKSFITINEQNDVLDIIEKDVKSGIISLGYYGFEDADDFQNAFRSIREEESGLNGIFISHIIDYLIAIKKRVFTYVETQKYLSVETDKDYSKILRDNLTYCLDFSNYSKDDYALIRSTLSKGCKIIFLCQKKMKSKTKKELEKNGILHPQITVYSGSLSTRVISNSLELKDLFLTL